MPNRFFIVGAVTLAFLAQNAVAKDTEEDIKLREALRQKLAEVNSVPSPAPAPAPAAPAPVVVPPRVTPPAPAAVPVPPAPPLPPPAAAPAPPTPPAPVPVVRPIRSSPVVPVVEVAPTLQDDPGTAQLREALRTRMAQEGPLTEPAAPVVATPPAPKVKVPAVKEPTPKPVVTAKPPKATEPEYVPLIAPPTPLTGSKEQRLQQLLEQYKADQITPLEYHTQRAKIIAE